MDKPKQRAASNRGASAAATVGGEVEGNNRRGKVWGRQFQKGQSGNPTGRSKRSRNLAEIARNAAPEAVRTLINIMNDKTASAAVRAYCADKVIDRAYGKAPQQTNLSVTTSQRSIRDLSDAELMSIIEGSDAQAIEPTAALPPPSAEPLTIEGEVVPGEASVGAVMGTDDDQE